MAIWMVFLVTIIPFSIAEADNVSHAAHESILVELGAIDSEGIFTTEKIYIKEQELLEFEGIISEIIDKILSTKDLKNINDIFNDIPLLRNSKFLNIFKNMFKLGNLKDRAFVVSSGHDLNFNFIKRSSIKIRNKFTVWHYNTNDDNLFEDKTIIVQPFSLKIDVLKGRQFGFMRGFTGIYVNIYRGFAKPGRTYFLGTAKNIKGFDFSSFDVSVPAIPVMPTPGN